MLVRPAPYYRSRSVACRVAVAILAAAQLLVLVLGACIESREGRSAVAHVEPAGVATHYAHNADDCAACVARALVSDAPRAIPAPPAVIAQLSVVEVRTVPPVTARRSSLSAPRAPPAIA